MAAQKTQTPENKGDFASVAEQAIEPVVASLGFELVWLENIPKSRILRLYIDGPNGVNLDDCAHVSRTVSDVLDGEGLSDRIDGRFTLEVSSPGLDRPLMKPAHFQRFVGRDAKVWLAAAKEGRRKWVGTLASADDEGIVLDVEGTQMECRYGEIAKARLIPDI